MVCTTGVYALCGALAESATTSSACTPGLLR